MRRIDGGIQQVQNIDEFVTITTCLKLKYKSKPSKCALAWCPLINSTKSTKTALDSSCELIMENPSTGMKL
jgi:hypothetical protein